MKKLVPPSWDSMEDFDAIIHHKTSQRRARLEQLRPVVESTYLSYTSTLQNPARTSSLSHDDAQHLVQCYETSTHGLAELKRKLDLLNETVLCPYCDINIPTTFDHHLPKHVFPELSVCAYNLVRACHSCQTDERSTQEWCDASGRRLLLHPYYDPIDEQGPLFVARIEVSSPYRVDYALNYDLSHVKWFTQFSTHWATLGLRDRYGRAASHQLISVINLVRSISRSAQTAQRGLKDYADRERRTWGPNHWRVALYAAAADDAEFIRYALRSRSHEA